MMNSQLKVDPSWDPYHPQLSAIRKLAQSIREGAASVLNKEDVEAWAGIFGRFPPNVIVDRRKKTKEPCD
jgi:hypothetical protein